MTNDVVVCFDATNYEQFGKDGDSNVVRIANAIDAIPIYEPGVGTRLGKLGAIGTFLGFGSEDRVEDQIGRLNFDFFRYKRIISLGGSRGACSARRFCDDYASTYPDRPPVYLCLMLDHVYAVGQSAAKRALPRELWDVRSFPRPKAQHVYHARAGKVRMRYYSADHVDADEIEVFDELTHGAVLKSPQVLLSALRFASSRGIPSTLLATIKALQDR